MSELLVEANAAVRKAREKGATALAPPVIEGFVARYWKAVRAGLAFHRALPPLKQCAKGRTKRRPGHNLLERLKTYKDDVLRFLADFTVPFTNNLAEQDLRMMKVKMKISGGFRTFEGASRFASLRSVVSTARKRGWNILQTVVSQPPALVQRNSPRNAPPWELHNLSGAPNRFSNRVLSLSKDNPAPSNLAFWIILRQAQDEVRVTPWSWVYLLAYIVNFICAEIVAGRLRSCYVPNPRLSCPHVQRPDSHPRGPVRPRRRDRLCAALPWPEAGPQRREIMAAIVARRLVEHLERAGFVLMKRPAEIGAATLGRGFEA